MGPFLFNLETTKMLCQLKNIQTQSHLKTRTIKPKD